jgi:cardiolipin synthase
LNTALLISTLVVLTGFSAALHALLTKRDSKSAFGWIGFCLVLPVAGPLTYLLFGINRVNQRAHRAYLARLETDESPSILDPANVDLRPMSTVGERVTGKGLRAASSVTLLENGEQLFPRMLQAIEAAELQIHLSSYIFDNDSVGAQFIDALCRARDRGVNVRIIVDALGELMGFPRARIGSLLKKNQLKFGRFNPITLVPPALHINMRNHRKILVVDGKVAFTGGQNIGERQLAGNASIRHRATDLHFMFTGKIVDELERAFLRDWYHSYGKKDIEPFQPSNDNPDTAPIWTRLVLDGPNEYLDRLNDLLVGILSTARQRVWIMTPYFLPGPDIAAALVGARLRGVDVKIILPSRSNIFLVHWANQNILPYYLEKDIEVYFQPPPFAHAKALIIDQNYSLIGSANLDARSLRLNFELGVEIFDTSLNALLASHIEEKLQLSSRLTRQQLKAISLPARIRNAIAWLFTPYL